jgi:transmembrane sensor
MEKQNSNIENDMFLAKWLEGEVSDAELRSLVSEADFKTYQKLKKAFNISEKLDAPMDESFAKIQERISVKNVKIRPLYRNWSIGIAASIALLFGLFSIFGNDNVIIETGFGDNRIIVLLDCYNVILNSKSKLSYNKDNWQENRTLKLEGEAYFKVEKGKTFTVKTTNGSVTVLGTQFNVKSTSDFFDVVCYEGKVRVETNNSEHILLPSNAVRKINGNPSESSVIQLTKPTWIDGESTFKSVPIRYVISALQDRYNVEFDTEAIDSNTIFSGSFPHNNLKVALRTVFETLDIKYIEKEKRNIKLRY